MNLKNVLKMTAIAAITASTMSANATDEAFDSTLRLIGPITISEVSSLVFPEQYSGIAKAVTVVPDDSGAAQFTAAGEPSRNITMSIVEGSIVMETGLGNTAEQQITVDGFTYGGNSNIAPDGSSAFDGNGALNNIRVGATALVEADDQPGLYQGVATLRITYI